jgi:hypothetical protein
MGDFFYAVILPAIIGGVLTAGLGLFVAWRKGLLR